MDSRAATAADERLSWSQRQDQYEPPRRFAESQSAVVVVGAPRCPQRPVLRRRPLLRRATLLVGAALVTLLAAGCEPDPASEGTTHVRMLDNFFSPPVVRVPIGRAITWSNVGRNPHNAIASDGAFSTESAYGNIVMPPGSEATLRFDSEGVFPYFCSFHGTPAGLGMAGVVLVGDVEYNPAGRGTVRPVASASGVTRRVPRDYPTIQSAVDAADPGDLVLVERGVYKEAVTVTTPSLVIRGVDRNEVILDEEFLRGNGVLVLADGVAVENMTARHAILNGFFWTGVHGYRASYLTAYNNGDYGIYAFDSTDGLLEHSYASGSPDSGFYIGQCHPCKAVVRDVIAENNALGYSGTNSGGELYLVSSIWRNNMTGIAPNTLDSELLPPERETTILANLVVDNNNAGAPSKAIGYPTLGNGILLAGGNANRVERNLVLDHALHGILVTPNQQENFWSVHRNVVRDNRVAGSGRADLGLGGPMSWGNCFEGNRVERTAPPGLQRFQGCGGLRLPLGFDLLPSLGMLSRMRDTEDGDFPHGDWKTQPVPGPQPGMPEAAHAPVRPAVDVYAGLAFDPASVGLPAQAGAYLAALESGEMRRGPGPLEIVFGLYGYYLPFVLLLVCYAIALRDCLSAAGPGRGSRAAWIASVLMLPGVGAALYLLAGRPRVSLARRLGFFGGGIALYAAILLAAFLGVLAA